MGDRKYPELPSQQHNKKQQQNNFSHFINVKWVCFINCNSFFFLHRLCLFSVIMNIYCEFQQHVSFTCRHFFFSDCTYIRTDETASGGGFDSFENWFRFQQNK